MDVRIMAIALGGCLTGEPAYGLTEDTGGHITYVLGAMRALAARSDVVSAEIVTRRFDDASLGPLYAQPVEILGPKLSISRIDSGNDKYLTKEALAEDRTDFANALIAELLKRDTLPDVIHAHFADAAHIAKLVRDALGIPFIYTAHSLGIDKATANTKNDFRRSDELANRIVLESSAMVEADAIIGSSRDECERQIPAYCAAKPGVTHLVRPGIDQTHASEIEIASGADLVAPFLRDQTKPIILAIARPVKKKNLAGLVEAFALTAGLRAKANLVILPGLRHSISIGEAEQVEVMRELTELIDKHDLYGSIAYPRLHSQTQVRGLYALAQRSGGIFVNPAFIEPFGLTILEAAAHGLPVVATCIGGPVDIIRELGHGVLVDPKNVKNLGEEIDRVLSDKVLWQQLSSSGRQKIKAIDWAEYARSFCTITRSILDQQVAATSTTDKRPVMSSSEMKLSLLICDIDNTLTGCRSSARRFSRFISDHSEISFGVATGRSLVEAQRLIREWDLPTPDVLITSVGSEIYWPERRGMRLDTAYAATIGKGWLANTVGQLIAGLPGVSPQADIEQRDYKLSYFATPSDVRNARMALSRAGHPAHVVFSHDRLLDILPANAGKHAAVDHVAKVLGIAKSHVIVAGDSGNDLDMIERAANAVVVANAEHDVLALTSHKHVMRASQPHAAGVLEGLKAFLGKSSFDQSRHYVGEAA